MEPNPHSHCMVCSLSRDVSAHTVCVKSKIKCQSCSLHSFTFFHLSRVGSGWQQAKQGIADALLPSKNFQLFLGITNCSQDM